MDGECPRVPDERLTADSASFNSIANVYEHVFLPTAANLGACNSQPPTSPCICGPVSPGALENKLHSPIASVNLQSSTPSQVNNNLFPRSVIIAE